MNRRGDIELSTGGLLYLILVFPVTLVGFSIETARFVLAWYGSSGEYVALEGWEPYVFFAAFAILTVPFIIALKSCVHDKDRDSVKFYIDKYLLIMIMPLLFTLIGIAVFTSSDEWEDVLFKLAMTQIPGLLALPNCIMLARKNAMKALPKTGPYNKVLREQIGILFLVLGIMALFLFGFLSAININHTSRGAGLIILPALFILFFWIPVLFYYIVKPIFMLWYIRHGNRKVYPAKVTRSKDHNYKLKRIKTDNRRISREEQKIEAKKIEKRNDIVAHTVIYLGFLPILLFGVSLIAMSVNEISYSKYYTAETTGTIGDTVTVEKNIAHGGKYDMPIAVDFYCADYTYEVDGETYTDSLEASGIYTWIRKIKPGQSITIRYNPDDPDEHYVKGYADDVVQASFSLILGVLFTGLYLLILVLGVMGAIKRRKREKCSL